MAIGAITTFIFSLAYLSKPAMFERVSNIFFDVFQQAHPREYNPDIPVRIVDIDDESIRRIGQWPWPRTVVADMHSRLAEAGAAVVAYDILFSEADRTSPENMLEVLRKNPNATFDYNDLLGLKSHDEIFAESFTKTRTVLGMFLIGDETPSAPKIRHGFAFLGESPIESLEQYKGALHPLPVLDQFADGMGYVSFQPDRDGIIRNAPLLGRVGDRIYPSLAVEALRAVQDTDSFVLKGSHAAFEVGRAVDRPPEMVSLRVGDFIIPTTAEGKFNIYYTRPPHPERYVPAWKILSDQPEDQDWQDSINGQIIFVGTGAEGLKDIVTTSFRGGEPGVLVHAQITEQILGGDYLYRPYWAPNVELLGLIFLGIFLTLLLPRLSAIKGVLLIIFIGNVVYWASFFAFTKYHYLIDPIYLILAFITIYILITLTSFYMTETERSRIRGAFSRYLSPEMVRQVSENPALLALGGEEKRISILFLDIRSFSTISETMRPQEITSFLNRFLTPMTDILQDYNATIDKYIGDAIVTFWNAPLDDPEHEKNAAKAVLKMQDKLADMNAAFRNQTEFSWPDNVSIGIGVNTGVCCVGNLGSEQRFSYSMIGDAANLASRIEGLTKQYRVSSLFGAATATALPDFPFVEADRVSVVGRETPETVYMLAGNPDLSSTQPFSTYLDAHKHFLEAYRNQDWEVALSSCDQLAKLAGPYNLHKYYEVMSARIIAYRTHPPAQDWAGIFMADQK